MPKKKPSKCRCVSKINRRLKKDGLQLSSSFAINFEKQRLDVACPMVAVEFVGDIRRGKKPPLMLCAYCPFCGKKIES